MNFLAEVISTADTVTLEEINKKMPNVIEDIQKLKNEVIQYSDDISDYMYFVNLPRQRYLKNATTFKENIDKMLTDYEELLKKAPKANTELNMNVTTLKKYSYMARIVKNLCDINADLIQIETLINRKDYTKAVEVLLEVNEKLKTDYDGEFVNAENNVKELVATTQNTLINKIHEMFIDNFQTTVNDKTYTIVVRKHNDDMANGFKALYKNDSINECVVELIKFIWIHIFTPIVDHCVDLHINETDNCFEVVVKVRSIEKPMYMDVFKHLETFVQFIQTNCNYTLSTDDEFTLLHYIGQDTGHNLSELLIKHCLENTIPSTASELQMYQIVIEETEKFEAFLRENGLFTSDTASIFEYINNIDVLFINKKCQEYKLAAETLMKKDLHDMVEVGTPYDLQNPLKEISNEFSQCSVSKSALEVIQLVDTILLQALKSSDEAAEPLINTAKNIFQSYAIFVPAHHQKLLQTIPQQVALFHNNCQYMGYEFTHTLNINYASKLSANLQSKFKSFEKEVNVLQTVGWQVFNNFADGQIKQIVEIMQETRLDKIESLDKVETETEKCIRQCMRQQELLKTVWQKVLSYSVYNNTLGKILDALCNVLISYVVRFEDISSNGAMQLSDVLKIISNRGPKLFTDPKEVVLYVRSWDKFQELNFVLNSSLMDINNKWADGKGPLALHFTSSELRQLIRALFQNTDRRAALLTKLQR